MKYYATLLLLLFTSSRPVNLSVEIIGQLDAEDPLTISEYKGDSIRVDLVLQGIESLQSFGINVVFTGNVLKFARIDTFETLTAKWDVVTGKEIEPDEAFLYGISRFPVKHRGGTLIKMIFTRNDTGTGRIYLHSPIAGIEDANLIEAQIKL